jgi:hypothetical protein
LIIPRIIFKDLISIIIEINGINFCGNIENVQIENVHIHHTGAAAISAPGVEG